MFGQRQRSVILNLEFLLGIADRTQRAATPFKILQHIDGRSNQLRSLIVGIANVLETSIVDELRSVDLAVADLNPVLHLVGVVRLARQHERTAAQSAVVPGVLVVAVANRQGLGGRQLIVDAWADVGACLRVGHGQIAQRAGGLCDDSVFRAAGSRIGHVRHIGVDDAVVLDVPPVEVKEERSLLAQRRRSRCRRIAACGKAVDSAAKGFEVLKAEALAFTNTWPCSLSVPGLVNISTRP